jgi:hypothetical protein
MLFNKSPWGVEKPLLEFPFEKLFIKMVTNIRGKNI